MAGIDIRARVGGVWRDGTLGSRDPASAVLVAAPPALAARLAACLERRAPGRHDVEVIGTVHELVAAARPDVAVVATSLPEAGGIAAQLRALGVPWLGLEEDVRGPAGFPARGAAAAKPAEDAPPPLDGGVAAVGEVSAGARPTGAVGWLTEEEATSAALPWALQLALERGHGAVDDDQQHRMLLAGQVAASVAHELNNPLTYLLTNLEHVEDRLLRAGAPLRDLAQAVSEAREASGRIAFVAGELGMLTRAPGPGTALVHPDRVFESVLAIARPHLRDRAQVESRYEALFPVRANEARLFQVLLNLVLNAGQAIEAGAPEHNRVTVGARRSGDLVTLFVRDTGSGIAAEHHDRVFEPFFTTKSTRRGTGLGLSLCRRYVEEMGGRITYRSDVGAGTEFQVELPLARGQRDRPTLVPDHDKRVARVLVVDDERLIGRAFARALSRHEVRVAESGEHALEILEQATFDLVFTDMLMPGMSGIGLYRAIAERWPALAPKVVFLSGGAVDAEAAAFLEGIPNPRFQKPIGAQQLRDIVGGLLRGA